MKPRLRDDLGLGILTENVKTEISCIFCLLVFFVDYSFRTTDEDGKHASKSEF